VNTNNFYQYLFNQFEISFAEKFAKEVYRSLYFSAENAAQAMEYVSGYTSAETDSKWFVVPGE